MLSSHVARPNVKLCQILKLLNFKDTVPRNFYTHQINHKYLKYIFTKLITFDISEFIKVVNFKISLHQTEQFTLIKIHFH